MIDRQVVTILIVSTSELTAYQMYYHYFSQLMKRAAKHINVKGHVCGNQKVMIYGPTDIEGRLLFLFLFDN